MIIWRQISCRCGDPAPIRNLEKFVKIQRCFPNKQARLKDITMHIGSSVNKNLESGIATTWVMNLEDCTCSVAGTCIRYTYVTEKKLEARFLLRTCTTPSPPASKQYLSSKPASSSPQTSLDASFSDGSILLKL